MTESLQPIIDEAERALVLIKLINPITAEDCDRVATEVADADADPFTVKQLAAVLKRRWVIDLPADWYPKLLDLDGDTELPQPELTHRQDGSPLFLPREGAHHFR
jgi:hypothetical protein